MSAIGIEELRTLFLFEGLSDDQLTWIDERSTTRTYGEGAVVYREGEPSEAVLVLLSGRIRMSRTVAGEEIVIVETDHRGAYSGAVRAYVTRVPGEDDPYQNTVTALAPSRFLLLPAADFSELVRAWFPMAVHLLDGLYVGIRNSESVVRQREHLAQLGRLSAGLAHELNNPAAAAVRAAGQLRERIAAIRRELGVVTEQGFTPETVRRLVELQADAVERSRAASRSLTPMQEADREDAVAEHLDELGVPGAYELAPVFAAAGVDGAWLDEVVAGLPEDGREGPLRWLASTLETEALVDEVEDSTARISALVSSVKQYAHLDQASSSYVDVHTGLDSTVAMLGHKLRGVQVVREYDRGLPTVPAYPGELNQVWTNLIDNAADAMGAGGTLVLRTARDGDALLVEVGDDGPGIAPDVAARVFQAFFTTKAPGAGSGLGLDGAKRIVERRHHGELAFRTGAGGTTFTVRLPLVQDLA